MAYDLTAGRRPNERWCARVCAVVRRNLTLEEWRLNPPGSGYRRTCPMLAAGA